MIAVLQSWMETAPANNTGTGRWSLGKDEKMHAPNYTTVVASIAKQSQRIILILCPVSQVLIYLEQLPSMSRVVPNGALRVMRSQRQNGMSEILSSLVLLPQVWS